MATSLTNYFCPLCTLHGLKLGLKIKIIALKENKEVVNRSKLRIHTRMWLMGKIKPKVYGKEAEKALEPVKSEVIIRVVEDSDMPKDEDKD